MEQNKMETIISIPTLFGTSFSFTRHLLVGALFWSLVTPSSLLFDCCWVVVVTFCYIALSTHGGWVGGTFVLHIVVVPYVPTYTRSFTHHLLSFAFTLAYVPPHCCIAIPLIVLFPVGPPITFAPLHIIVPQPPSPFVDIYIYIALISLFVTFTFHTLIPPLLHGRFGPPTLHCPSVYSPFGLVPL